MIASTLTFIGSVTPIIFQGARPIFIDSDRISWNMDPGLLAEELEKRPERVLVSKAVVLGHLWLKVPYLKPACISET